MSCPIAWILNELGQKMYAWATTKSVMDFDRGGENGQTLQKTLNDLFSSVSEGKSLIAAAVTEKGVETAADSSFQQMANNIQTIENKPEYVTLTFQLADAPHNQPLKIQGEFENGVSIITLDTNNSLKVRKNSLLVAAFEISKYSSSNPPSGQIFDVLSGEYDLYEAGYTMGNSYCLIPKSDCTISQCYYVTGSGGNQ